MTGLYDCVYTVSCVSGICQLLNQGVSVTVSILYVPATCVSGICQLLKQGVSVTVSIL